MAKRILVISTSLRGKSNSERLADAFIQGASENGNDVEKVTLKGRQIHFCTGCLVCQKQNKCVIDDDAIEVVQKMQEAEVLVFATPIYYYEMCGQMKTLLDRSNSLYPSDYAFRVVYLLATAAEAEEATPQRAASGLTGWVDCFEKASFAGMVFAGGVNDPAEIEGHPVLQKAYELGKSIS